MAERTIVMDLNDLERRMLAIETRTISEEDKSLAYQRLGAEYFGALDLAYDPAAYQWSPAPAAADATCRDCYEWRRYPLGQRHFGFAWWRRCDNSCTHPHHADEIWIA